MNARLPNKWRNGLTVGTGIFAAFGKTGLISDSSLAVTRLASGAGPVAQW